MTIMSSRATAESKLFMTSVAMSQELRWHVIRLYSGESFKKCEHIYLWRRGCFQEENILFLFGIGFGLVSVHLKKLVVCVILY